MKSKKIDELVTIDKVDQSNPATEWKKSLVDYGRRRHLSYTMDFDTRAYMLEEPQDTWDEDVRTNHIANKSKVEAGLAREFGEHNVQTKIENFKAIGTKPFSVVSYHNVFFEEVRRTYVMGAYYPALVGACALGERILNHLVLELRGFYTNTKEYKKVHRKSSFDNWKVPIDTLEAWGVLRPKAVQEFLNLMNLRHRSIHFNPSTYASVKLDSLSALNHLREIIDEQFTAFGVRPWFIDGTKGQIFIKREWEEDPFIKTFYLPSCPFVGPYFAISFEKGFSVHDFNNYGQSEWTDQEFSETFNNRKPEQMMQVKSANE